jgi:hypothetical protein
MQGNRFPATESLDRQVRAQGEPHAWPRSTTGTPGTADDSEKHREVRRTVNSRSSSKSQATAVGVTPSTRNSW